MTVKYTEEQMALIKDALNNARQLVSNYFEAYHRYGTQFMCVTGAQKRLDKLAEIIDNGIVEETE